MHKQQLSTNTQLCRSANTAKLISKAKRVLNKHHPELDTLELTNYKRRRSEITSNGANSKPMRKLATPDTTKKLRWLILHALSKHRQDEYPRQKYTTWAEEGILRPWSSLMERPLTSQWHGRGFPGVGLFRSCGLSGCSAEQRWWMSLETATLLFSHLHLQKCQLSCPFFSLQCSFPIISKFRDSVWCYWTNTISFYSLKLLSSRQTPQAGGSLLVGCPQLLIQYVRS